MYDIKVEFAYQWKPVLRKVRKKYCFPEEITTFMRITYKYPSIYRWNIFMKELEDEKLIYIGEAQDLYKRINGYLNPGHS